MNKNIIVWLDLETTGLDPVNDLILEIGIIITDWDLNEKERKNWIISQPKDKLEKMNDYVKNLHNQNGLIKLVESIGKDSKIVEKDVCDLLNKYNNNNPNLKLIMAGNSIDFDKNFIKKYFKDIYNLFSYRIIDASSFILLFERWIPKFSKLSFTIGNSDHRSLDDLDRCLFNMRKYKDFILKCKDL